MERSLRWAERCQAALRTSRAGSQAGPGAVRHRAGRHRSEHCARASPRRWSAMDLPGYAHRRPRRGRAAGQRCSTRWSSTAPRLPADKPRYLMGVGTPDDLIESVARGVDMFDCVMPTRAGRHGLAFTWGGKVNLRNACHADDTSPLDPASSCPAARDYSRAYLHHLVKSGEFPGRDAAVLGQCRLLPGAYGRYARRHRRRAVRCMGGGNEGATQREPQGGHGGLRVDLWSRSPTRRRAGQGPHGRAPAALRLRGAVDCRLRVSKPAPPPTVMIATLCRLVFLRGSRTNG